MKVRENKINKKELEQISELNTSTVHQDEVGAQEEEIQNEASVQEIEIQNETIAQEVENQDEVNIQNESEIELHRGSIIIDKEIRYFCDHEDIKLIQKYNPEHIESASYDLTIEEINIWELQKRDNKDYVSVSRFSEAVIHPYELAFIISKEIINLPSYMIGRIVIRNSFLRAGLLVNAPLFQPGDKGSNVIVSVYNQSKNDIVLKKGDSVVQIYFEILEVEPDISYTADENSHFKNSTSFKIPYDCVEKNIKETEEVDTKINNFETRIYTMVATFVGALVSILALIVTNFAGNGFVEKSWEEIVKINISLSICIVTILTVIMSFCCHMTKMNLSTSTKTRENKIIKKHEKRK